MKTERLFSFLLRLYSAEHRVRFDAEMRSVPGEAEREQRAFGKNAHLRFALVESFGLIRGAAVCRAREAVSFVRHAAAAGFPTSCGMTVAGLLQVILYRYLLSTAHHRLFWR